MSRPEPVLRAATTDDADRLGAVHYTSFVETYTGLASSEFWDRASAERSAAGWRRWLDGGVEATVAEVDGAIVGLAVAGASKETGGHAAVRDLELSNLYVLAAHHGTGVGQALLDAVLPPATPAQLWVAEGNPRAVRFYRRNGFEPDGATDDGATFGGIAAVRLVR
ncbi:GNAT family N-acetyltransferase [Luteimicrobium sp. DT211]|uniref:GNAT family N-acetyltransferase n=1 Tax=Luteimicrobium sp. DT211 TaxID=3393412 RepID=UPI003CFA6371